MKNFHVNPKTGAVGVCAAKANCPFGDKDFHFSHRAEAEAFAEALSKPLEPRKQAGHLIIIGGLPGSGKSTLAAKMLQEIPGSINVNRDNQRTVLAGEEYHNGNPVGKIEATVTAILRNRTLKALREGRTVIDDNTNVDPVHLGAAIKHAKSVGATFEIIMLDVPIEEAKRRNRKRGAAGGRLVPEFVIDRMAKKIYDAEGRIKDVAVGRDLVYFVPKVTPNAKLIENFNAEQEKKFPIIGRDVAIVDIDGTLCHNHEALDRHVGAPKKKNWEAFFAESAEAPVNQSVLKLVKQLRAHGINVFAMTGRTDANAEGTIKFLQRSGAPVSKLLMGRDGDYRGDYYVKTDNLRKLQEAGFRVVHSIDDRPSSIAVWEEASITVSRVEAHEAGEVRETYEEHPVETFVGAGICISCEGDLPLGELIHETCRSN